jgi:hypothetical protein
MRRARRKFLGCSVVDRGRSKVQAGLRIDNQFPQHRVDKRCGRTFAGTLHEFYAFVDSGAGRNSAQPSQLIDRQSQCDENFKIKLGERL